ncbi:asparagine--tRNA ligase [Candidatus Woesearchaeota archaeon]|nr:asparagine--tRNA ligase [Candidatus Woesearchaeota archaeon]
MEFISVQEALNKKKGKVAIRGWVYRERKLKDKVFLVIRDSSNVIQCIVNSNNTKWNDANKLLIESSVEIFGDIYKDKRAPTGYEIKVEKLNVVHFAEKFPITEDQSQEFLLDKRHLWIRSRKLTAVMKVRSTVFRAIDDFFFKQGYYEMPPPIFTPAGSEGGGPTLFEVKYFNDKAYLTQSWQLYAEASIFSLEKIFCISPCFRAERSKTSRHLAEFWMAEVETAWQDLDGLTKQAEELVSFIVQEVIKNNSGDLKILGQDIEKLKKIKVPFPRLTYTEVLKMLKKDGIKIPWGKDLRTVEEDKIMEHFDKPLIVTHYPKDIMAFYKPKDPKNPKVALCFDMLALEGYGEIIGGSERDLSIEEMKKFLKKKSDNTKNYEWYFDTRKYGSIPHSGFGLGVERVVSWLCKLDNIKDAIPFPRTMLRFKP